MLAQMEGQAVYDRAARARARDVHLLPAVLVPDLHSGVRSSPSRPSATSVANTQDDRRE